MITTENYGRFKCLECGEHTTFEPGRHYEVFKINCRCKPKEEKEEASNTEIFKPVGEEKDYYNATTVTVIGTYENGDYAVTQPDDEKVYRMDGAVFEQNYKEVEILKQPEMTIDGSDFDEERFNKSINNIKEEADKQFGCKENEKLFGVDADSDEDTTVDMKPKLTLEMFRDASDEVLLAIKKTYTVEELRECVRDNNMRGYTKAKEDELINMLVKKGKQG